MNALAGLARGAAAKAAGAARGTWLIALVYLLLTIIVVAPVYSVPIPGLGDYLNHLARIHVLISVDHNTQLQRFYETHWRLVPYFGMDAPLVALSPFMGLYSAGQLFIALCVMMPVAAAASLHYAIYRRVGLMPLCGFLLSWNYMMALGFLPYLFSAGLAVMLFAAWIATPSWPRWRRAALFSAGATLVYLCHLFAFLAYGLLVGGYELARLARRGGMPWRVAAANFIAAGAQALPAVAMILLVQDTVTFGASNSFAYSGIGGQIAALLMPLYFPGPAWLLAAYLTVPLAALVLARRLYISPSLRPAILCVTVAACCVPHVFFNVWGADFRLPLVVAIAVIGATTSPRPWPRPMIAGALAVIVALTAARAVSVTGLLRALATQVADVRTVLTKLPTGQRLLIVQGPVSAPSRVVSTLITSHLGLLATIDRDAFVPTLFSSATAVQVRPAFQNAMSPNGLPISYQNLWEGMPPAHGPPPPFGTGGQKYWLGWPDKFDYVLILHFGAPPATLPPQLSPLTASGVAALYRIGAR